MLSDAPDSDFKVGQVWSYKTRPGEESSIFYVLKVERHGRFGIIVHIAIKGLRIEIPENGFQIIDTIPHMPFDEDALSASATSLLKENADLPEYEEGYQHWRDSFENGEGGVFDISVDKAIDYIVGP